jgi:threonine dehydrogenase-like Zn-dependent dehydrogenase
MRSSQGSEMYAVIQNEWGGPETLEVVEKEKARPAPTEVLVRVVAAGVNPVDVYTRMGVAYNQVLRLPFVNGWDVAGVVEEIGYGVTRFRPGDRVFGMPRFPGEAGAYATYVTAPSRHLALIPDGVSRTDRPRGLLLRLQPDVRAVGSRRERGGRRFDTWRSRAMGRPENGHRR